MSHTRCRFTQSEGCGRFTVGQVLEVSHENAFAVVVAELPQSHLEAAPELLPHRRRGWRQAIVAQLVDQLDGRTVFVSVPVRTLLSVNAALPGLTMTSVRVDQSVESDAPEPSVKGNRAVARVLLHTPTRLDENLLHDITGVDARRQRGIEPQLDDPAQSVPVPRKQQIHNSRHLFRRRVKVLACRCLGATCRGRHSATNPDGLFPYATGRRCITGSVREKEGRGKPGTRN